MHDRLDSRHDLRSWFLFLVPGKVLQDYTQQYGKKGAVEALRRIRFATIMLFFLGAGLIGWQQR
jgi:hypothetical protein